MKFEFDAEQQCHLLNKFMLSSSTLFSYLNFVSRETSIGNSEESNFNRISNYDESESGHERR